MESDDIIVKGFTRCLEVLQRLEAKIDSLGKVNSGLDGERLLDNQDICMILKIDKKTLEKYRRTKVIPYLKLNGKIYYKMSEVLKCMKKSTFQPKD